MSQNLRGRPSSISARQSVPADPLLPPTASRCGTSAAPPTNHNQEKQSVRPHRQARHVPKRLGLFVLQASFLRFFFLFSCSLKFGPLFFFSIYRFPALSTGFYFIFIFYIPYPISYIPSPATSTRQSSPADLASLPDAASFDIILPVTEQLPHIYILPSYLNPTYH
jgi:hypothetical protein